MASTATRREFLRLIYRQGLQRETFLDDLAQAALKAQNTGKSLVASGGEGFSSQYLMFNGWRPDDVLAMVDWARGLISEVDIDTALALIPRGKITTIRTDFRSLGRIW